MKITTSQLRQMIREEMKSSKTKAIKEASRKIINPSDIAFEKLEDSYKLAEKEIEKQIKGKRVNLGGVVNGKNYQGEGIVLKVDVGHDYDDLTTTLTIKTDDGKKLEVDVFGDVVIFL